MDTNTIQEMSVIDRIQTMEAIWDSLLHNEAEIESPEWHKNILANRKRKIVDGNAKFTSIKKLKERYI